MEFPFSRELKRFNDLHGEIGAAFHDAAVAAGISDSVQSVLYTLLTWGGDCTQSDISRSSGLSRQTIHSAVQNLERQGLLYLEGTAKHKSLRLTPAGMEYARKTVLPLIAAEKAIFDSWSLQDREQLLDLTEKYAADLRKNLKKENL